MVRTVKGITLSPQERSQAGYGRGQPRTHTCSVTLPGGPPCDVTCTSTGTRSHTFVFGAPLNRTGYAYEAIGGGLPGLEAKAQALAGALFQQAQQHEQQAMRQKAPGTRTLRRGEDGPPISVRMAAELAGRYAVCVKCVSGTLIRVGGTYPAPEGALAEIESDRHSGIRLFNGQQLVVGICNRAARHWEEARFITRHHAVLDDGEVPATVLAQEAGDTEEEDEEPNIALTATEEGDGLADDHC